MTPGPRPLSPDERRPLALVLSGGGARGAFQVGVWKTLRGDPRGLPRPPEVVSGTSAGAINAALLAAGLSPEAMLNFWLDLADSPPVVANERFFASLQDEVGRLLLREPLRAIDRRLREARLLGGVLSRHRLLRPSGVESMLLEFFLTARFDTVSDVLDAIKTRYLFDISPLSKRLEKAIGRGLRTEVRLAINTVDAATGSVVRIVNHRPQKRSDASARHYRYEPVITPEMVLASAAIPLLFSPVRLGELELWDGGLLVNTPMAPAVALGGRRLIPVLVTPKRSPGARPDERFGAAVEQLADAFLENAYNADRKLLLERNKTALRREDPALNVVELFEAIRPGTSRTFNAGSYLYFERKALLAMHEAGQLAARAWLDRGPPGDSPEKDDLCFGLVALSHVNLVAQLLQPELLPVAAAPPRGAPVLEDRRAGATGRLGEGVAERRPRLAMQGGHGAISSRAPTEGRGTLAHSDAPPGLPMKTLTLFDIAKLAYERGYLDLRRLLDTIYEAGRVGDEARLPSFWINPERLTIDQLRSLVEAPAPPPPPIDEPPPSSGPASVTITLSGSLDEQALRPPPRHPAAPPAPRRPSVAPPPLPSATPPPLPPPPPAPPLPQRPSTAPRALPPTDASQRERYQVKGELGVGGMGRVIEVEDKRLGRRVAVKSLRADLPDKELPARLLEREASITGSLEHPNIIPVYDAGHDPTLGPYYIMRVLKQPTLLNVLSKLRRADLEAIAEFTVGKLLRLFIQVCHAIDYANSQGIVHCDLKPANILLGSFGEVLVVDWGFAQRIGEAAPIHGGTPGYMAPEQLDPTPGRLDGRADVFALGTVLYELLTLRKAYPSPSVNAMLEAIQRGEPPMQPPPPPRVVTPGRVPEELDEICVRALAIDPSARFQSARALADALDLFLEGTKEKERRLLRAVEMTSQGDELAASYDEMISSRPDRAADVVELLRTIEPWQGSEEKQSLWDAEDRNAVLDALAVRTFQSAVSTYEHALDELPGHAPARRGLARLYLGEAERARERRDAFNRIYFEGLVHQYDDGSLAERLTQSGTLQLDSDPPGLLAEIKILSDQGRRLVASTELPPERTPLRLSGLDPGNYLLEIDDPESAPVRYPVLVRPGVARRAHVDLRQARQRVEGELFIPGGPALLGGHESSLFGRELLEVDVPSFFLSALPVSFADFLEFLEELFQTDPALADQLLPAASDGAPYWQWNGTDFIPAQVAVWGESPVELLCLPAVGVDLRGALAYLQWRSQKTGLEHRLPTEAEWEKAARGTDGRAYPWGDHFDPSFCKMRLSRRGPPAPEPSGAFPHDESPYGVRDLAGGVADWVLPGDGDPSSAEYAAARGGAWCDWSADCHAAARRLYWGTERSDRVGFRLARSPA